MTSQEPKDVECRADIQPISQGQGTQDQLGTLLPSYTIAVEMDKVKAEAGQPADSAHAPADGQPGDQWTLHVPQPVGHLPTAPEATIDEAASPAVKAEPMSPAYSEPGQMSGQAGHDQQQRGEGGRGAACCESTS